VELKNPYGAYRLKIYEAVCTECGSLENEKQFNELKQNINEMDTVEYFSISRFIDGEIKVEHLV